MRRRWSAAVRASEGRTAARVPIPPDGNVEGMSVKRAQTAPSMRLNLSASRRISSARVSTARAAGSGIAAARRKSSDASATPQWKRAAWAAPSTGFRLYREKKAAKGKGASEEAKKSAADAEETVEGEEEAAGSAGLDEKVLARCERLRAAEDRVWDRVQKLWNSRQAEQQERDQFFRMLREEHAKREKEEEARKAEVLIAAQRAEAMEQEKHEAMKREAEEARARSERSKAQHEARQRQLAAERKEALERRHRIQHEAESAQTTTPERAMKQKWIHVADVEEVPINAELYGVDALRERNHAHESFRHGRYEDAGRRYSKLIDLLGGSSPQLYVNRALCFLNSEKYEEAVRDGLQAAELDTSFVNGQLIAARAYMMMRNNRSARQLLTYASKVSPEYSAYITQQFTMLSSLEKYRKCMAENDHAGAVAAISSAMMVGRELPLRLMKVDALIHTNRDAAQRELVELGRTYGENPEVLYLRAKMVFHGGQDCISLSTALQLARRAIEIHPQHPRASKLLEHMQGYERTKRQAVVHMNAGRHRDAYEAYTRLVNLSPENKSLVGGALASRASVCFAMGNYSGAITDYTKAISLDDGSGTQLHKLHLARGNVRKAMGQYGEAVLDAEAAYRLSPTSAVRAQLDELRELEWTERFRKEKDKEKEKERERSREREARPAGTPQNSHYETLGAARGDSAERLSSLYRKKAFQWHPDKWAHAPAAEQEKAEEKFKQISQAYAVLSDPSQRRAYDRTLNDRMRAGA